MKNLYIIACISKDYGLGQDGDLLWHFPEDMRFFRATTTGSTVVMGRKTYDSIGRPLPKRQNIILTRDQDFATAGDNLIIFHDRTELDRHLGAEPGAKYIIGGASLYAMYLDEAEKLYLTEVDVVKPADTYFPKFDKSKYLRKVLRSGQQDGVSYEIAEYTRSAR